MTPSFGRDEHLAALRAQGTALAARAERAGLDAVVPSCPGWTIAHLVAHQSMVHRWAAAKILGDPEFQFRDDEEIRRAEPDLLGYYRAGHAAIVEALERAPADLDAPVFLTGATSPREFWTRRQLHETTIHAVDALAGELGRVPTAAETDVDIAHAVDGLDELLRGFLPDTASALFEGEGYGINVCPTDVERAWSITVGPELATVEGRADAPAATFVGSSAQLYLGLWNRGHEIDVVGDADVLRRWREAERINWG